MKELLMKSKQDVKEIAKLLNENNDYHFEVHNDQNDLDNFYLIDKTLGIVLQFTQDDYRKDEKTKVYYSPYRSLKLYAPEYVTKNEYYMFGVEIGIGRNRSNSDFAKEIARRLIPDAIANNKEVIAKYDYSVAVTYAFQLTVDRYKAFHPQMRVNPQRRNWDVCYELNYFLNEGPYARAIEVHMDGTSTITLAHVNEELAKKIIELCQEYEPK